MSTAKKWQVASLVANTAAATMWWTLCFAEGFTGLRCFLAGAYSVVAALAVVVVLISFNAPERS